MLLEGLHIPIPTPFHPDGRLNLHKLASNVARYSKTPASGLIVLGPSAEPTLLSDDETREVLRTVAQSASPDKVLTANISRDSAHATLALAAFAAELQYDAVLVSVPTFLGNTMPRPYKGSKTDFLLLAQKKTCEQCLFFQAVADRSPLPVLLLSNSIQMVHIPNAVQLAAHPNIIGLLDAGTDPEIREARVEGISKATTSIRHDVTVTPTFTAVTTRMKLAATTAHHAATLVSAASLTGAATAIAEPSPLAPPLRTRTKSVGFQILSGNSGSLLDALNAGATGIAPAVAACAPQACHEVYAAWKDVHLDRDESKALATEKQQRIIEGICAAEASPAALKYAADLNGYFGGSPRLPHLPLTGAERAELELAMKDLRN
jgi:4-hydroxy-2-oxoglutarate aldolase